jgi:hypothetical protein
MRQRMVDSNPDWGEKEWRAWAGLVDVISDPQALARLTPEGQQIVEECLAKSEDRQRPAHASV